MGDHAGMTGQGRCDVGFTGWGANGDAFPLRFWDWRVNFGPKYKSVKPFKTLAGAAFPLTLAVLSASFTLQAYQTFLSPRFLVNQPCREKELFFPLV